MFYSKARLQSLFAKRGINLYPMLVAVFCMSYYTGGAIMSSLYEAAKHETQPDFRLKRGDLLSTAVLARGPIFGSLINVMKHDCYCLGYRSTRTALGFTGHQTAQPLAAPTRRLGGHQTIDCENKKLKALLFVSGWINGFIIAVIASSNASIVGVDELISRCNNGINASGHTDLMIPIYLYGSLFFLLFCFPLSLLIIRVKRVMTERVIGSQD